MSRNPDPNLDDGLDPVSARLDRAAQEEVERLIAEGEAVLSKEGRTLQSFVPPAEGGSLVAPRAVWWWGGLVAAGLVFGLLRFGGLGASDPEDLSARWRGVALSEGELAVAVEPAEAPAGLRLDWSSVAAPGELFRLEVWPLNSSAEAQPVGRFELSRSSWTVPAELAESLREGVRWRLVAYDLFGEPAREGSGSYAPPSSSPRD